MKTLLTLASIFSFFVLNAQYSLRSVRTSTNMIPINANGITNAPAISRIYSHHLFPCNDDKSSHLFFFGDTTSSKIDLLKNNELVFNTAGERVSVASEIVADYLGPVRASVSTLISNGKTDSKTDDSGNKVIDTTIRQENSIQDYVAGGGNLVLTFSYPVFHIMGSDSLFGIKATFNSKSAWDIPSVGSRSSSFGFNSDIGFSVHAFATGSQNKLSFFANARPSIVLGNNLFFDNLNKQGSNSFFFLPVVVGLSVNSYFQISWTNYFGDSFVTKNFNSALTFTITPN